MNEFNKCESPLEEEMLKILLEIEKLLPLSEIQIQYSIKGEGQNIKHSCHDFECFEERKDGYEFSDRCFHENSCICDDYNNYDFEKYRLDFVLFHQDIKLDIECDGKEFHEDKNYDLDRDSFVEDKGFIILRFTWDQIFKKPKTVKDKILKALKIDSKLNSNQTNLFID